MPWYRPPPPSSPSNAWSDLLIPYWKSHKFLVACGVSFILYYIFLIRWYRRKRCTILYCLLAFGPWDAMLWSKSEERWCFFFCDVVPNPASLAGGLDRWKLRNLEYSSEMTPNEKRSPCRAAPGHNANRKNDNSWDCRLDFLFCFWYMTSKNIKTTHCTIINMKFPNPLLLA